jgi:hypothetical protein
MPTHEQVERPFDAGHDPDEAGGLGSSQHLRSVPVHNPTSRRTVHDWILRRVAADPVMRAAQRAHDEQRMG